MRNAAVEREVEVRLLRASIDHRARLVQLLATGLERYLNAHPKSALTPASVVCLYDGHGDDDEAAGE